MNRFDYLNACKNHPTKYENLYFHISSVFEFVYVDDEFIVEARNCRDLKFKLSLKGITLHEREVSVCEEVNVDFVNAAELEKIGHV